MADFVEWAQARAAGLARSAYLLTGDHHAAEDLLRATLVRVADRWRQEGDEDPDGLARREMHRLALDWHGLGPVREGAELAALPSGHRTLLSLRLDAGLSEADAAAELGLSRRTVRTQTRTALARLPAERLGVILADATPYVPADPTAVWRAETWRRARRWAAIVAVVLAVVGAITAGIARQRGDAGPGPDRGFPARIAWPIAVGELPDRPGRLAAVVGLADGWLALAPDGTVWDVPQQSVNRFVPALSADGTRLGYLSDDDTFVIRDLMRGTVRLVPGLGDGTGAIDRGLAYVSGDAPGFWSPDDTELVLYGSLPLRGSGPPRLPIVDHGRLRGITPPGGRLGLDPTETSSFLVGWLPDGTLAWLLSTGPRGAPPVVRLVVTDDRGRPVRSRRMAVPVGLVPGRWSGSLSPDGRSLAVSSPLGPTGTTVFRTSDAHRVASWAGRSATGCLTAWRAGRPVLSRAQDADPAVLVAAGASATPEVTADPRWGARCTLWSAAALAGPRWGAPEPSLWRSPLALAIGGLLGALLLGAWLRLRRRTWRRRFGGPSRGRLR